MASLSQWSMAMLEAAKGSEPNFKLVLINCLIHNNIFVFPEAFVNYNAKHSSWTTLNKLLDRFVQITGSKYGFILQTVPSASPGGSPQLQTAAASNIAWSAQIEKVEKESIYDKF